MDTHFSWLPGQDDSLPDHVDQAEVRFQKVMTGIHQELVESLDLSRINQMDRTQLEDQLRKMVDGILKRRKEHGDIDRERLHKALMCEVFGLGPLDAVVNDDTINDILVNDPHTIYVEQQGILKLTKLTFADATHLFRIIQRIVARLGRRIDEVSPMVDARLPDGSRVNAVIPPLAIDGPALSIRRFGGNPLNMGNLLGNATMLQPMSDFLRAVVASRIGMVMSGGTGAGKTTLLNSLSAFIPEGERVVTIEDSAELILQHRHRIRMETRPANAEGTGAVTQRDLVRNTLRMRPDRIIVGEVRGAEVWDMLQAMNTGHEGSLTTIHSNGSEDALARLEMMAALTGFEVPVNVLRQYVALGIRMIAHVARLQGGIRRVTEITEIVSATANGYETQKIFGFEQTGVNADGVALGHFYATGVLPKSLDRIKAAGVAIDESIFEKRTMEAPIVLPHAQGDE